MKTPKRTKARTTIASATATTNSRLKHKATIGFLAVAIIAGFVLVTHPKILDYSGLVNHLHLEFFPPSHPSPESTTPSDSGSKEAGGSYETRGANSPIINGSTVKGSVNINSGNTRVKNP